MDVKSVLGGWLGNIEGLDVECIVRALVVILEQLLGQEEERILVILVVEGM